MLDATIIKQNKKVDDAVSRELYYGRPGFKLYNANCLDILAQLPENSIDMIFADPPYFLSNGGFTVHAGRQVSVNKGAWDKSNGLNYEIII
ncbi:MAG: hypothetical protein A3C58_00445 [Candidatus Staskawiczbacteria bacterium RIFCSPHIGHO2_02_FULL_34_10]|uniref:DNA methylase N-4/N-6 domain-containing protein n=2 Tax=Candidatus Staskawicziibacteriota TaxID=1817916 RepID=A0A1G2HKD0_9BACT|nr:MAG: hypothetical protein A2639_00040 [Candidatus Staskawiczbacteria bacterium RIFCSPHIGHO2_01_FULL_34_27]OGZ66911.1 MAG: hypothetical protein A3C58_00445 [Candidatus Staskawiczbacteria bacterium RIFCSPHIGHO2_02_FULL_34_10]